MNAPREEDKVERQRELREAERRGLIPDSATRTLTWGVDEYRVFADRVGEEEYGLAEEWFRYIAEAREENGTGPRTDEAFWRVWAASVGLRNGGREYRAAVWVRSEE